MKNKILLLLFFIFFFLQVDRTYASNSLLNISCHAVANSTSALAEANFPFSIVYHEADGGFLIMYTNRSGAVDPVAYDRESMISIAYGGNGTTPWSTVVINVNDSTSAPTPVWADSHGVFFLF